jgi:hypothetical protein
MEFHYNMASDGSNVSGNWQRYPEQKHVLTSRPTIPYAQMIVQAIESSPEQKSTLKEIYEYISENYPFFRTTKNGWKVRKFIYLEFNQA